MDIDPTAPVISRRHIHVAAPLEAIWTLLTDINGWTSWNPVVSKAELDGPLAPGTVFRWKSGGMRILSTLQDVEPMRRVSWTGRMLGINAIHVWILEKEDGGVLIRTAESFDGPLARIFKAMLQRVLDRSLEAGLHSLKTAAERPRVD